MLKRLPHQIETFKNGILNGNRALLAKAITLVESTLPQDQKLAGDVLKVLLPHAGNSLRIGVTGPPGVGKSTFIESFGRMLTASGKKIAVLTIDPSSQVSKGSILGDKTRMQELAGDANAFIRPSPSGHALGGVALATRETMILCEAAGFEIVIVETVGTGQSEIAIKRMVDFFLLLIQPGAGDELQGIKKGIVEMADAIAITKDDGENSRAARKTEVDFRHALHLLAKQPSGWSPKVLTCSAVEGKGLKEIWSTMETFKERLSHSGYLTKNRHAQQAEWFKEYFNYLLSTDPQRFPEVTEEERNLTARVEAENLFPRTAAQELLKRYHQVIKSDRDHLF